MKTFGSEKRFIERMPKCELHVHVEGATTPETFYRLAQLNKIKLPVDSLNEWKQFFNFTSFKHFIDVYISAVSTLKKPEDYTFLIEQFYKHQAAENIRYTEAYLSASFLVERFSNKNILKAIKKGIKQGTDNYKVEVNFIPDIARNIPETKEKVLDLIIEGYKSGVFIGLGLGGAENGYPPEMFTSCFDKAKKAGLHLVAHAGEAEGPKSIWGALQQLNAERIGHGVRCLEDTSLVEYLKQKQIPLEVSPQSNYCLGIVAKNEYHPIRKMVNAGLYCTLNSDDPAMFSTSLSNEYLLLLKQGFTLDELWTLNMQALKASFLADNRKKKYIAEFEKFKAVF